MVLQAVKSSQSSNVLSVLSAIISGSDKHLLKPYLKDILSVFIDTDVRCLADVRFLNLCIKDPRAYSIMSSIYLLDKSTFFTAHR